MRKHFVRKLFSVFLAVAAVSVTLIFLGGWSLDFTSGSKQVMKFLTADAALSSNGDMKITETWQVQLNDRGKLYRNFYRTFQNGAAPAGSISGFTVYDEDLGTQYTFAGDIDPEAVSDESLAKQCYIHKTSDGTEIGWFMPGIRKGTRTFRISYTIQNLIQVYGDAAELYYKFLPESFSMPVETMKGTIQLPAKAEKDSLHAWLHSDAVGNLTISSGSQINFSVEKIPKETYVEVRLLTPTEMFASVPQKHTQNVLSSIEKEENSEATDSQKKKIAEQEHQRRLGVIDVISAAVVLAISIAAVAIVKVKNKKFKVQAPEYTHDVPSGNSPAGIANLYYFYGGAGEETKRNRIFSSTMLSLARKGHLRFDSTGKQFSVSVLTSVPENRVSTPLTDSEKIFYELLASVSEDYDGSFTMKQFKQYAKKHYKEVDSQISSFFSASKREIADRGYFRSAKKMLFGFLTGLGTVMFFASFAIFGISGSSNSLLLYFPLSLLVGGILFIIAGHSQPKLTQKGEYELAVWYGLKKYMLEFSRMTEYSVPELPLWEEYLVYATMMGISQKVCKQLKLVYPQISNSAYWESNPAFSYLPYFFWNPGMYSLSGPHISNFDFGSALGNAMGEIGNAATRLAHPLTSSSGRNGGFGGGGFGGGSFSGGGGGFGGGGGGVR